MRMPQENWPQEDCEPHENVQSLKAVVKQLHVQSLPEKSGGKKKRDAHPHLFGVGSTQMNQEHVSVSRLYAAMP